jgi:hypothetical protein
MGSLNRTAACCGASAASAKAPGRVARCGGARSAPAANSPPPRSPARARASSDAATGTGASVAAASSHAISTSCAACSASISTSCAACSASISTSCAACSASISTSCAACSAATRRRAICTLWIRPRLYRLGAGAPAPGARAEQQRVRWRRASARPVSGRPQPRAKPAAAPESVHGTADQSLHPDWDGLKRDTAVADVILEGGCDRGASLRVDATWRRPRRVA